MTMSAPPADATRWPDNRLTALLQAAVSPTDKAMSAWRRWQTLHAAAGDDAQASSGEARILPLVWWNLRHASTGDEIDALQLTYRSTWVSNQETLAAAATIIDRLHRAGIETMLLRGAALLIDVYPRTGLRPVGDVDVLVHREHAQRARRLIVDAGLEPNVIYKGNALSCVHSLNFERPRLSIDLHWHALKECQGPDDDRELWEYSRTASIAGTATRVPSSSDHLILVCAHGLRWTATQSVHWLADAALLVNRTGEQAVDWDRLIAETRARRLTLSVRRALEFLHVELDAPVPSHVLEQLAATPVSWRDRVEHDVLMRPPSLWRGLVRQWCEHSRVHARQSWPRRVAGFPERLRSAWGVPNALDVPAAAFRKIAASFGYASDPPGESGMKWQ